jgi:hypothetical protein
MVYVNYRFWQRGVELCALVGVWETAFGNNLAAGLPTHRIAQIPSLAGLLVIDSRPHPMWNKGCAEKKGSILRFLCRERARPCGDYLQLYPQKMRRIAVYIYELRDWPKFRWDREDPSATLAAVRHRQGRLIGRMEGLGFRLREEAELATLTQDVLKSSEIEGEILDRDQVRSSIARRLGLDIGALTPADRHVEGVVEMTLDATQKY